MPETSPEKLLIEQTPGLSALAPRVAFSGLISHADATVPFLGEGVAPEPETQLSSRMEIVSGQNLSSADEAAVILGEGLARSLGVVPGDTVVLLASTPAGSPTTRSRSRSREYLSPCTRTMTTSRCVCQYWWQSDY